MATVSLTVKLNALAIGAAYLRETPKSSIVWLAPLAPATKMSINAAVSSISNPKELILSATIEPT